MVLCQKVERFCRDLEAHRRYTQVGASRDVVKTNKKVVKNKQVVRIKGVGKTKTKQRKKWLKSDWKWKLLWVNLQEMTRKTPLLNYCTHIILCLSVVCLQSERLSNLVKCSVCSLNIDRYAEKETRRDPSQLISVLICLNFLTDMMWSVD